MIIHQYTYGIPDNIDFVKEICNNSNILFIEDCVNATLQFFNSNHHGPINIGSEEKVSINEMIENHDIRSYDVRTSIKKQIKIL